MELYCVSCGKLMMFEQVYNKRYGNPYHCCKCNTQYVPQTRKTRREIKRRPR